MSGLFGGNTPTPPVQPQTQFPNMGGAASNAFGDIGNLNQFSLGGSTLPQILQLAQSTAGGVGGAPGTTAMNTANMLGPLLTGAGLGGIGAGGQFMGAALGGLPYVQQLLQTSMDPQKALYDRTASQVLNQTGANLANTGVGTSPYGASVLGNTASNFNIDWQNQQLQRQLSGLGGATSALTGLGSTAAGGLGLEQAGGELGMAGGMLPFSTLSGLNTAGINALTGAIGAGNQAAQVPQTAIGDWLSYLSGGQSAIDSTNRANLAAAQFQAQQEQQQWQNIASAVGGLGSSLGGLFGAGGIFGAGLGGGAFGPQGMFSGVFGGSR